jgi:heme/copper-type cytochrome/quinol oxidase subunit 2
MSRVKKFVATVLMLTFMLGGGCGLMMAFVDAFSPAMATISDDAYGLVILFFCLMMLCLFVGMCVGIVLFMFAMRPFMSKEEMYDVFIFDPEFRHPQATGILENLLELIY